ncbi:MAG: HigA family addiction module antitoxin [Chitinophagaceae bacterium]
MKRIYNVHPGEILSKEFLNPLGITRYRFSKDTGIRLTTISDIVHRRKRISPEIAAKLSKYFGNTSKFWLELQEDYDEKRMSR